MDLDRGPLASKEARVIFALLKGDPQSIYMLLTFQVLFEETLCCCNYSFMCIFIRQREGYL